MIYYTIYIKFNITLPAGGGVPLFDTKIIHSCCITRTPSYIASILLKVLSIHM